MCNKHIQGCEEGKGRLMQRIAGAVKEKEGKVAPIDADCAVCCVGKVATKQKHSEI